MLADLEHPGEIWGGGGGRTGHITDIAVGSETGEETVEGRRTTDLPVVRE